MTYAVCLEKADGRIVCNNHVSGAENPAEVEDEIAWGDEYVVSNSKKHVRVKRSEVVALVIELRED